MECFENPSDAQKKKIEEVEQVLRKASDKYGENSDQALKWQQVLNRSQTSLNDLENELEHKNEKALEEDVAGT